MTAVAIFVKTPGVSPVKTRLAATVGAERAASLYRRCASAVAEAAIDAGIGAVYWATAEAIQEIDGHWPDLPGLEQGSGGLGERMHRVMEALVQRHGSGLLLGADAPQIDPAVLIRAARHLERAQRSRVVGPARDGGFWTFGVNHALPRELWTRTRYSRPDTMMNFRNAMGTDADWLELPMLCDLDTAEDMQRVTAELLALENPLPGQRELIALLKSPDPQPAQSVVPASEPGPPREGDKFGTEN